MQRYVYSLAAALCAVPAVADTINFDTDAAGALPAGWVCGTTGRGSPPGSHPPTPRVSISTASPAEG